jgi:cell division transport system permease protein
MLWVNIKRIIRTGFFNFSRNAFVSLSSILVMIITLSVLASLIFISAILNETLLQVKNKVDINVYFTIAAPEAEILSLQKTLEGLPEVSSITYTSREQALEDFKLRHENDELTLQAIEELGQNPLQASLNIKAKNPSEYEGIADFLQNKPILSTDGSSIVEKVNYYQNKVAIDTLSRLIATSERLGTIIAIVLIVVSILITLNTVRLAIYISREEISVMRLVGASSFYVRGPFVVVGVIYGALAGVLTLLLFYPITYWLGGQTSTFFINFNVFDYYTHNFGQIFLIIMFAGMIIGAISSYIAVRKYLKV